MHVNLADKRVLITGGAGLIGSAIAMRLVGMKADVTVVDALLPQHGGNRRNLQDVADHIKMIVADLRDPAGVDGLVDGVDVVFNLAGQSSHLDSMTDPLADLDINSRAQVGILEALRRASPLAKVIFASTRQVYGRPRYLPVDEAHPVHPVDVNGINKLSGEWFHRLYHEVYGLQTSVLRLTNTYGPGMRIVDARQTFLGVWILHLLRGEPFEIWGGAQLRDFNYVEDVADAFLAAAVSDKADGRVFNLGSREVVSLRQVGEMLVDLNGGGRFEIRDFPEERRRIDIGDCHCDFAAIETTLGWQPRMSLRNGLQRTLEYYRHNMGHYA
ncbi:MAG: UDP-glucose 4-epimerase [Gammaproteobacteria bacterium]|nr:UDP-glucose 4-epimerase [Gammaproteobacteria bacterium]